MRQEVMCVSLEQNSPEAMFNPQDSDSVQELRPESMAGNNEDQNFSSPETLTDARDDDEQLYDAETPIEVENPVSPTASSNSGKKSEPNTPPGAGENSDGEDSGSVTSSGASGRTMKSKITVGVAPSFTCNDRLEKRKEYYAKLEEKRKALEAEKREYEARTKEEEEAALKQLRKNMMFKASPVPNFYYEKPPPKKELKKAPTTRAVSPRLGRRKSCGDLSSAEEMGCSRASRHSLGGNSHKDNHRNVPCSNSKVTKDRSKQVKDTTKNTPTTIEQSNADIAVQS